MDLTTPLTQSSTPDQSQADIAAQSGAAPTEPTVSAVVRPDYVPETFWDAEKGEVKLADVFNQYTELQTAKSKLDERLTSIPKTADDYKLDLEGLKLPEGATLDQNDPLFKAGREMAHKLGLTQTEFDAMAKVHIQSQIAQMEAYRAQLSAEKAKLGPQAEDRVNALTEALAARLGEDAKIMVNMLASAAHVAAFEKLLQSSPGQYGLNGRSEADPQVIEGWESMSFAQKAAALDGRQQRRVG